jgi:hypothetical protein
MSEFLLDRDIRPLVTQLSEYDELVFCRAFIGAISSAAEHGDCKMLAWEAAVLAGTSAVRLFGTGTIPNVQRPS